MYGAAIGDAIGVGTEFMSADECAFYYDVENLDYKSIKIDEHRVKWERGDWTCNADQMVGNEQACLFFHSLKCKEIHISVVNITH